MDKKDIYEHLAKIYLDNSSTSTAKKKQETLEDYRLFIFIGIAILVVLGLLFLIPFSRHKPVRTENLIVLAPDAIRLSYNLHPAKKEIYSFDLQKANLSKFNVLGFALKKDHYADTISLRVELVNAFNEKSEIYIRDIPTTWKEYKILFTEFKSISNWSEMSSLSFVIEEWNTKENSGEILVDNVRFFK
ncbi:MAG TPA: hypothetical protein P5110_09060 [Candidatus Omnitrophota bacterium]|nr:hypothetical protein [Candidatus Omnitrophota bacterium]HRZ15641.1 hypothetical protein [Candidatus Omnitrophota bacterium]